MNSQVTTVRQHDSATTVPDSCNRVLKLESLNLTYPNTLFADHKTLKILVMLYNIDLGADALNPGRSPREDQELLGGTFYSV